MSERKFVIRELKVLARQLDGIKLRYKYDWETNAHVVEVPKSIYDSENFISFDMKLWDRFHKRFPCVMLVFIPDDSDMGIDDIKDGEEYIIYGKGYTHSDAKPQGVLPSFWRIRKKVASMAAV